MFLLNLGLGRTWCPPKWISRAPRGSIETSRVKVVNCHTQITQNRNFRQPAVGNSPHQNLSSQRHGFIRHQRRTKRCGSMVLWAWKRAGSNRNIYSSGWWFLFQTIWTWKSQTQNHAKNPILFGWTKLDIFKTVTPLSPSRHDDRLRAAPTRPCRWVPATAAASAEGSWPSRSRGRRRSPRPPGGRNERRCETDSETNRCVEVLVQPGATLKDSKNWGVARNWRSFGRLRCGMLDYHR